MRPYLAFQVIISEDSKMTQFDVSYNGEIWEATRNGEPLTVASKLSDVIETIALFIEYPPEDELTVIEP